MKQTTTNAQQQSVCKNISALLATKLERYFFSKLKENNIKIFNIFE